MPVYVYRSERGRACCRNGFETLQPMRAAPLKKCPTCGAAVRRIPQPTLVNTRIKNGTMMDSKLRDVGFTKLTRDSDGRLRKQFGRDPAASAVPSHSRRK
jgi:putative FmdB family regulatory protein